MQASTIVTALGMDKSAVSRHVKELREHGLGDAERDEQDARVFWITPTPSALASSAEIVALQQQRLRARLEAWSPEDVERFAELLDRLSQPTD